MSTRYFTIKLINFDRLSEWMSIRKASPLLSFKLRDALSLYPFGSNSF
jgi:hypothetical protein